MLAIFNPSYFADDLDGDGYDDDTGGWVDDTGGFDFGEDSSGGGMIPMIPAEMTAPVTIPHTVMGMMIPPSLREEKQMKLPMMTETGLPMRKK